MDTMRALVLTQAGLEPVLEEQERPLPAPGPGQVRLRVGAAGFSHHDALVLTGLLRRGVSLPRVPGHEVAGEVEAVGEGVAPSLAGLRAVVVLGALGHSEDGAFATHLLADAPSLVPLPSSLDMAQAVLLAAPLGVALKGLDAVAAQAGETVVVTGASGGLGLHAAQAAHALGARVLGVSAGGAKLARLEALGCFDAVLDADGPWAEAVRALTDEQGAAVVVDTVGGPGLAESVRALAVGGRCLLLGELGGEPAPLPVAEVLFRGATLVGSLGVERRHAERALALVLGGRVSPVVDRELPLDAAGVREALGLLRGRSVVGRVVLRPA
jgi:acryloyl-coenzyme A reductase